MPQSSTPLPFELHQHGPGAFVIFESSEIVALPLHMLAKATLRGRESNLTLQFNTSAVVVDGQGLGVVLEHLLASELKVVRCAKDAGVEVLRIQVLDTEE